MFLLPLGILNGADTSWTEALVHNLLPVTLGNWNAGGEYDGVESLAGIGHTNDSEVMGAIDRERKALHGAHGDGGRWLPPRRSWPD